MCEKGKSLIQRCLYGTNLGETVYFKEKKKHRKKEEND